MNCWWRWLQNSNKVEEVKNKVKEGETRQVVKNLIENKLFVAEQNREKELQKRLENLRKHVGFVCWLFAISFSWVES